MTCSNNAVIIFVAVVLSIAGVVQCAKFDSNGYELVVAIHKDVPEDVRIISHLQNMLTSASEYLYTTTRKYVYIRHVTILVPDTWNKDPSWRVEDEIAFNEADIRVDSPHPAQGNIPYTFQPGQCGEEGRYIHLTPDFVLDRGINRDFYFGDAGRVLVHEFAHLRFGVFDEYGVRGSSQHRVYYIDDQSETLQPTACSHEIEGFFVDLDNDLTCESEDVRKPLSDNCDFLAYRYRNKATASVMFAQFLEQVTDFCESNPTNLKLKHNADAPNRHNKMCNGRGTWDVIREHPDVAQSTPAILTTDRTPTIQVVYRQVGTVNTVKICGRRFVFVLDLSGSMLTNERYFKLRQMADKTIRDILPKGTEVGIVVFSTLARIWSNMTFLTSPLDRDTLARGLPEQSAFDGSTAIGRGLKKGIELLEMNGKSTEKARIFLITDGGENVEPFVSSVMGDIIRKKLVVHTLAYSDDAATVLQLLSTNTGGQYSFFDESGSSSQLESAGQRLLSDVTVCEEEDDSVEIDRHAVLLTSSTTTYEREILIDSTIGNNTLFVFTLGQGASTEITVTDRTGNVFSAGSPNYSKDSALNIVRFLFPMAQTGRWKYNLKKVSGQDESVVGVVKSQPRAGALPFQVETWTSSKVYDYKNGSGVVVYTYVRQGYAPVIRAKVEITASRPKVVPFTRTLNDDGKLPDNTANDGVYANYLLGFKSNSRYSMEVKVESVTGETVVIKIGNLLSGRTLTVFKNLTVPVIYEPVEHFSRTASPGAIDIKGYDPAVDQIDPSKVTDLDLAVSDKANKLVTLTWTAPGDDLNTGTVSRYDIRIADSFDGLRQNFLASYALANHATTDVVSGSLNPLPAGWQQMLVIRLPSNWKSDFFVFGLKSTDDGNRTSMLSNLRSITLKPISIPQRPTTTTTFRATTSTIYFGKVRSNLTPFIVGMGVSLGLALTIFVLMVICIVCIFPGWKHTKNDKQMQTRQIYTLPLRDMYDKRYP